MVSHADALPSFPLPSRPSAPSRAELALQGVDKAFLNADIVDPALVISVDDLDKHRNGSDIPVLSSMMKKRLKEIGISEFFAVQAALLPFLLPSGPFSSSLYCPYGPPRDVCISAPTGSGKTLAYAIPIVETLARRIAIRLRALVVVPTRDLALQVQETMEAIGKGRGLKIGVVTGHRSFAHEQSQIVENESIRISTGGSCKIDILICTPGRLIDHLTGTPGFTLQHLRFLVIDEADHLLMYSFQDWLTHLLWAPHLQPFTSKRNRFNIAPSMARISVPSHDIVAPPFLPDVLSDLDDLKHSSCQKLFFSATLTSDPSKVVALGLRDPKYFIVQSSQEHGSLRIGRPSKLTLVSDRFEMPLGLKEYYVVASTKRKPLMLFYLIHEQCISNALIFTKSASSTSHLAKLFEFYEDAYLSLIPIDKLFSRKRIIMHAYSSDLRLNERRSILERFKHGEIDILVCSDLVSRGLDISHVAHVVSYDAPVDIRKYIHRVGRTARAGRSGDAWTLVEEQEMHYFRSMLKDAGCLDRLVKKKVTKQNLTLMEDCYRVAIDRLKEFYCQCD